jgi:hypothetical protein
MYKIGAILVLSLVQVLVESDSHLFSKCSNFWVLTVTATPVLSYAGVPAIDKNSTYQTWQFVNCMIQPMRQRKCSSQLRCLNRKCMWPRSRFLIPLVLWSEEIEEGTGVPITTSESCSPLIWRIPKVGFVAVLCFFHPIHKLHLHSLTQESWRCCSKSGSKSLAIGWCWLWASWVTTLFVTYEITQTFRSWCRLRHIKESFSASLSKWWLIRAFSSGQMHFRFWEVCNKYGTTDTELRMNNNLTLILRLSSEYWTKSLDYKWSGSMEESLSCSVAISKVGLVPWHAIWSKSR